MKGLNAGPWGAQDSAAIAAKAAELSKAAPARSLRKDGDPGTAFGQPGLKVAESAYQFPFIVHATMEPQNCTAHFKDGKVEIWSSTQFLQPGRGAIAGLMGIPEENVAVHMVRGGGGFGWR